MYKVLNFIDSVDLLHQKSVFLDNFVANLGWLVCLLRGMQSYTSVHYFYNLQQETQN